MQKTPGRKYQVVEEAEIDLVLQCRDSHEFYERYLQVFPDTKKSLDSISKIWKRKSEFAKKRPQNVPAADAGAKSAYEIASAIAEQTKILNEISLLAQESLEVNKQILAALTQQNRIMTGHSGHEPQKEPLPAIPAYPLTMQKPSVKKKAPGKNTPILVGS